MARCRRCGKEYTQLNSFHIACSPFCARVLATRKRKEKEKRSREIKKAETLAAKPYSWHVKKAQTAFNKFIRERDKALTCISCGRHHSGQYHAGHFITTGSRPELRFHPYNCHKQCAPCNNHLSGNIIEYRPSLIAKVGPSMVDYLENFSGARATIEELGEIEQHYKNEYKRIKCIDK